MSHLSIGIIKHRKGKKSSYLIMKVIDSNAYKFFEVNSTAIGARFEFSEFKKHLENYFELSEVDENQFTFLDEAEWKSEKQPSATVYEIELNQDQFNTVSQQQKEKGIEWVEEKELHNVTWEERQKPLVSGTVEKIKSANLLPFENDFLASVEKLQDAKKSGKLVIFAGAGVSANSGIPLWHELIEGLKEDITVEKSEKDYLVLAQLHYNSRLNKEYFERVQTILKHNKVRPNHLHKKILSLKPMHIITTNYDNLFEQEIRSQALPYSEVKKDSDLSYSPTPNLLVKMHGDFDERNIVLKEDDYSNYSDNFPLIEGFVKGVFASKVILFVGFSFNDINLKYILQRVRNILGEDFQPAYLFSPSDTKKQRIDYLKNKGVHVISPSDKVEEYLKERDALDNVFTKENEKRERKTYNFLKFLEEYNRYTERGKDLYILDKMYDSLKPFRELPFIPTKTLVKLPPFAVGNQFEAEYDNYHMLKTRNEELLDFLDKIKVEGGKIVSTEVELSKESLDKLESVFDHLNRSCIIRFQRQSDYIRPKTHSIYVYTKEKCGCVRCLNESLNFSKLLLDLSNPSSAQSHSQSENLELLTAYAQFKVGNFLESYEVLKKVSQESWYRGKYITYFLCKSNMLKLKTAIQFSWDSFHITKEEKDAALKELNEIDIDAILQQLPIENYIKEALKQIRLETFLRETERSIRENLEEITKNFNSYLGEGYYKIGGVNHVDVLREKYIRLHLYYKYNLLFENEFSPFYKLTNLFWEGLIISYSTSNKFKGKQRIFYSSELRPVIYYAHPKSVLKAIKDYMVETLQVDEESLRTLIEDANNFFKSNHRTFSLFETTAHKNESHFFQQEKSQFYKSKSLKIFKNLLIILAYSDLSKCNQANRDEVIINLLRSFRIDKELKSNLDYFKVFIFKQIHLFNDNSIKLLLNITIDDDFWSDALINETAKSVVKTNYRIDSNEYLDKVFARTSHRTAWKIYPIAILPLFKLFNDDLKSKFAEKVISNLNEEDVANGEMSEYYRKAVELGIIDWNEKNLFPSYCNFVAERFPLAKSVSISDKGRPETNNFEGWNVAITFADFVHEQKIPKQHFNELMKDEDIPNYLLWLLDPESFDYRKFSIKWILAFNYPVFIEQLKGIDILKSKIESYLKKKFNAELAEVYFSLGKK